MGIILIGNPITTKLGTKVSRYVENGRMYKLIDFMQSSNNVANKKGLTKTLVSYGKDNKPEQISYTFKTKPNVNITEADIKSEEFEAQKIRDRASLDTYSLNGKNSVLYLSYDKFIRNSKQKLIKYRNILPKSLYDDITKRYGTEEKSIRQILNDNSFDLNMLNKPSNIGNYKYAGLIKYINNLEKKEYEYAQIRLADAETKKAVIMTNAWTSSGLRFDLGYISQAKGNWSLLKPIWRKCIYPEQTIFSTDKLIDAYLIFKFNSGIRSFHGENPLKKYVNYPKVDTYSIRLLKGMYKYSQELEKNSRVLNNPLFLQLKKSTNITDMKETIENLEEHYKNSFFKMFWTDERKDRFSKALLKESSEFDKKIELSNDIYETIIKAEFMEE